MFIPWAPLTQPGLLTQNTSVTLTHICRIAPAHSITTALASLSFDVSPYSERTNKSCDFPAICSPPLAWSAVKPAHQGQALHRRRSISTALCSHQSVMGTGQSDALQLEKETRGLCPWQVPAVSKQDVWARLAHIKERLSCCHCGRLELLLSRPTKPNYFISRWCFPCAASACLPGSVNCWPTSIVYTAKKICTYACSLGFYQQLLGFFQLACTRLRTRFGQLHASCICMPHEHNLVLPNERSFHPFALF